ncbi:MAG: Gp15 family bacteriophage protein [Acutalibacteraceae bacterium]
MAAGVKRFYEGNHGCSKYCNRRCRRGGKSDPYYDLIEDFDLVVSSLLKEYGIRVYSDEFRRMGWGEFCSLLSGIDADTPLGRVVLIRAETDQEKIRKFSSHERRIYNAWRNKKAQKVTPQESAAAAEQFRQMFVAMAGEKH